MLTQLPNASLFTTSWTHSPSSSYDYVDSSSSRRASSAWRRSVGLLHHSQIQDQSRTSSSRSTSLRWSQQNDEQLAESPVAVSPSILHSSLIHSPAHVARLASPTSPTTVAPTLPMDPPLHPAAPHLTHQDSPPPPRASTILNFNLLRGRRQSQEREVSPDPNNPPSPSLENGGGRGIMSGMGMLRRRRSGGAVNVPTTAPAVVVPSASVGATHRIRLVPHLDSRRALRFDAITRDLKEGDTAVRIGRFTERSNPPAASTTTNKIAFKSKVVSRAHAEVWCEAPGVFYVRDTRSSSGTFLNHVRLSPANTESRASVLRDGDILQLGVDYQGGTEDIYKSVKIRVEVGREWQGGKNAFNTNALKNLKSLAAAPIQVSKSAAGGGSKANIPDCCICLFAVSIRQALFIAPCSHTFHYKCIRPLLENHHPAFTCPLCRTFADLEEDVEIEVLEEEEALDSDADDEADKTIMLSKAVKEKRRQEDRERDAGAETEVEGEGSAGRRRSRMEIDLEGIRDEEAEAEADVEEQAMDVEAPTVGGPTLITHPGSSSGSEEAMDVGDEERVVNVNEREVKLGS